MDDIIHAKQKRRIASVDGEPVQVREFKVQLLKRRAHVLSYFRRTHDACIGNSTTFWTDSYDGEVPEKRIKEQAMEAVVRIKIEQSVAKEQGIVENTRYSDFLKGWQKENKRRTEALENNKIIYGPKQYKEEEYFEYVFSNMVIRTKEVLARGKLAPTDDELETYYRQQKEELFDRENEEPKSFKEAKAGIRHRYIGEEYEKLINSLVSSADISINKKIYQNIEIV